MPEFNKKLGEIESGAIRDCEDGLCRRKQMNTFKAEIMAADRDFYHGECISMVIPTIDGEAGIMAGHEDMIFAIAPGVLRFKTPDGGEQRAASSAGLCKVEKGNVLVLVDAIERPEEIDINRAKRAADEAREALLQKKSIEEYRTAQASLARAINRLRIRKSIN